MLRGMCADGKQLIAMNGGFVGETRYYDESGHFVGSVEYTDFVTGSCLCPAERFRGTREAVRCDAPVFEALCDTTARG